HFRDVHVVGAGIDRVKSTAVRRESGLPGVGHDVNAIVSIQGDGGASFKPTDGSPWAWGWNQIADRQMRKDRAAAVDHVNFGTNMGQVRFGAARMNNDVPAQVVG